MKLILIIMIAIAQNSWAVAQSNIEMDIDITENQKIVLEFDEANIVRVTEWDKQYIQLEAKVNINDNTQNDAFQINSNSEKGRVILTGYIQDKENLPQVIRIKKGDQVFTFQTDDWDDPLIQDFYRDHGRDGIQWKSHGISWDIELQLKVPQNKDLEIVSKHGVIELNDLSGSIQANSMHGGIDVTFAKSKGGEIDAKTKWGTIYSNLDLKIDKNRSSYNDWNHIVGRHPGSTVSSTYDLESKHANIYLRY